VDHPEGTRIYIAHEQDELPNTANAGQTVCSVFDYRILQSRNFLRRSPWAICLYRHASPMHGG